MKLKNDFYIKKVNKITNFVYLFYVENKKKLFKNGITLE